MSAKRLSVIIPTFNRRSVLQETIKRILPQIDEELDELIIVNDGSTDDTSLYLSTLNSPSVVTIEIQNSGPGKARNVAAQRASGEIILFVGDDIQPANEVFISSHLNMHEKFPELNEAVLGKTIWPSGLRLSNNFVMAQIQGRGGQQFGYAHFRPYGIYDWRFFYTSNISVKRAAIENWSLDGFSDAFPLYGYEDIEFGYRLAKKYGSLKIIYAPTAVAEHFHSFNVNSFLTRQRSAGMMASKFSELHPEAAHFVGVDAILNANSKNLDRDGGSEADYMAILQGLKSWAQLIEAQDSLGSAYWHEDFINVLFECAYLEGIAATLPAVAGHRSGAYKYILNKFSTGLHSVVEKEFFAVRTPSHSRVNVALDIRSIVDRFKSFSKRSPSVMRLYRRLKGR